MTLEELIFKLKLDHATLQTGLRDSRQGIRNFASGAKSDFDNLRSGIKDFKHELKEIKEIAKGAFAWTFIVDTLKPVFAWLGTTLGAISVKADNLGNRMRGSFGAWQKKYFGAEVMRRAEDEKKGNEWAEKTAELEHANKIKNKKIEELEREEHLARLHYESVKNSQSKEESEKAYYEMRKKSLELEDLYAERTKNANEQKKKDEKALLEIQKEQAEAKKKQQEVDQRMVKEAREYGKRLQEIREASAKEFAPTRDQVLAGGAWFGNRFMRGDRWARRTQMEIDRETQRLEGDIYRYGFKGAGAEKRINYIEGLKKQLGDFFGTGADTMQGKIAKATEEFNQNIKDLAEQKKTLSVRIIDDPGPSNA